MKKNIFLVMLFTVSFYCSMIPMELTLSAHDDVPGIAKNQENNEDYEEFTFNELAPVMSASIAFATLFERADMGVDEKIDALFQKGCSVVWKGCVKIAQWFTQE